MDSLDTLAHTFITKLWVEETADESGLPLWHGHITHVPSGKKRPVREPDDITRFVLSYLGESETKEAAGSRLGRWMAEWKDCLRVKQSSDRRG